MTTVQEIVSEPETPVARMLQPKTKSPRHFHILTKKTLAGIALAAALLAGGRYGWTCWVWSQAHEETDNAFIDGHIAQVSPRVTGHVAKVYVSDNQFVHAGDLLLELDAADYQAMADEAAGKLTAARADLVAARNVVGESQSQIAAAEANVAQARAEEARQNAELQRARADFAQYERARETGALSTLEFGKVETAVQTAEATLNAASKAVAAADAQVSQARSALQAREGQVAVAEAQIKAAEAAVERATLNISYTKVTATADGRITRKSVEPGNYVIPGQPLMALVSPNLWVTANFKETQLRDIRPGQNVEMEVDAYPGMKLKGRIDSIQQGAGARFSLLPPENATGNYVKVVQRVPVKIVLDEMPADGRVLGPGMSVVPVVQTK